MIIYNVTINIDDDVHDAWLSWMEQTHIPEVMQTGLFIQYTFAKLLSRQEDETGTTYVIQYTAKDMANYEKYQQQFAPALQAKTRERFDGKFVAFRTLMETRG
ncbi:MAG: DUF4286 family protein [Bacteroidia bacterium]|jgi:hypothetical protein|nr:DUF4286 family protein [Bacteroidia bacterium]